MDHKYVFDVTNAVTGEVIRSYETDAVIVIPIKQKRLNHKRWIMGDQNFFYQLAQDKELNITDRRVLDYLISVMDFENYVSVPQDEIANKLGVSVRSVRRSIAKLKKKGILRTRRVGKHNAYMLNPEAIYKGKIKKLDNKILEFKLHKW